jgi:hypothetical protein
LSGRFHLLVTSEADSDARAQAFVWLKRRIEESGRSGYLAVPDSHFVTERLAAALGHPLAAVLSEEGRLRLGWRLGVRVKSFEAIRGGRAPVAAFSPSYSDAARLATRSGPVLIVTQDEELARKWTFATGSRPPPPERFPVHRDCSGDSNDPSQSGISNCSRLSRPAIVPSPSFRDARAR